MIHSSTPPGYYTATEAAAALHMSRQNLYQSGLVDWIDSWKIGAVRLFSAGGVGDLAAWLRFRRALIALSEWPADQPLLPPDADLYEAVRVGDYEYDCPICGGVAVDWRGSLWCERDGINEYPR